MSLIKDEYQIISKIGHHPNLINCLAFNDEGSVLLADGIHDIQYMVLEKCKHGSLARIIRQTGPIEEEITKFLFIQMVCAVKFMHDKNYAHLDIKLENILLDDYFNIKLSDLGSALNLKETMGLTSKRRGTYLYMAPEVKNKDSFVQVDGYLADVYSLGVCLHLLLTGEFP